MGLFHCPVGAPFYDDEACIDCGMCSATTKEEMVAASKKIRAYIKSSEKRGNMKKIAVTGKGGVGKSTVVTLLARELKKRGYNVLVLDTDESNPGLYRMFGFNEEPRPLTELLGVNSGKEPDAGWLKKEQISFRDIPREFFLDSDGLRFLMVGKIIDPFQGCACSLAGIARDLVARLTVEDKELLLVDTEAGIESFGRGVERSVGAVLVVVEPSFESMVLAEKVNYMAGGMGISCIRAILNKVPSKQSGKQMIGELNRRGVKTLGAIYFDRLLFKTGFEGSALTASKATSDMEVITDQLISECGQIGE